MIIAGIPIFSVERYYSRAVSPDSDKLHSVFFDFVP
jgi:hypothetical protein